MIARAGSSPLPYPLSPAQKAILELPLEGSLFLEGPAGCGKTTVGVARLLRLLQAGTPSESILILTPHRPLAEPYLRAVHQEERFDRPDSSVLTIAGLAQRAVRRFWLAAAGPAGFAYPNRPPTFMNHETAQYIMALVTRPLLAQGYFESVTIEHSRLFSEILDNLNRAAGAGFPYTEISRRLKAAWAGEPVQLRAFDELQECAIRFRQFCLAHNLLDFSLLLEIFAGHLWPDPQVQDMLGGEFRHLIAENLEEDVPLTHNILRQWLPRFASALLIYDYDAGYRLLAGADPQSAYSLKDACDEKSILNESFVMGTETRAIAESLISRAPRRDSAAPSIPLYRTVAEFIAPLYAVSVPALALYIARFYPQILDWAASQTASLVHDQGVAPQEIALLIPGLNDAVLFALTERLEREGVPVHSFRPSRPLRAEPVVAALLTLAALAHAGWFGRQNSSELAANEAPTRYDLAYALAQLVEDMDLVRAQLLAEIVYRQRKGSPTLTPFSAIRPNMQERITLPLGARYETLRIWLEAYRRSPPLDLDEFWGLLLQEVLQTPGFRLASDLNARQAAENLVDSARNFRLALTSAAPNEPRGSRSRAAAAPALSPSDRPLALEFLRLIQEGVAPAQYLRAWSLPEEPAVFIASPYTFLLTNRPVEIQFWLDASSRAWGQRPYQPLTHPYVLSRAWPEGRSWSDEDEWFAAQHSLHRLALGLARRCRRALYVCASQLSEQGFEQTGPLPRWLQIGIPR